MRGDRGFSLLEVLIATTILTVTLVALAQLVALSVTATTAAKETTMATVLGMEKMEQLRSLTWGFDASGLPVDDPRLAASPSDALVRNITGFCDFVDADGQPLGDTAAPPPGAVYVRRWSIEPLPADPANGLVLQVRVTRRVNRDIDSDRAPSQDGSTLVAVRTRKAL